jgi:hypothetical protein
MSEYKVRRIRKDAHQVSIYNSGGTIFLYDDANSQVIKEANPSLLMGYYGIPEKDVDTPLLALGEKGLLVVFELRQDDELQAEVSLGPPVDQEKGIPWSKPREAFLSLPSGTLCIESMDCLRIGTEEPTDEGARLALPPGDYVVSLQGLSPDYEQDPDALAPEYYLSLVPLLDRENRPPNQPFLAYPRD